MTSGSGIDGIPADPVSIQRDPAEEPRIRVTDRRRGRSHDGGGAGGAVAAAGASPRPPAGDPVTEPAAGELEAARAELAACRDQLQRLSADFDNARKRMLKDQTHAIERASQRLVTQLLEILDEFRLAMMHGEQSPEFAPYLKGFELVYIKLFDTLRAEGLERIAAEGEPFDPMQHEALMQTGQGEAEPVVSDVLREGYTFKGKVLRPAGVTVHRSEE
jgi:molecular chaperone GrpE